jgi:hypothetical protein
MKTSSLTALLTFLSLGTPALLGCAFCEEARGYYPRYEMAQAAPVARGERIQPLAPKLAPTNSAEVSLVSTNASPTTNAPVAFKDGGYFGFEKLSGYSFQLASHLEYATNIALADAEITSKIPANIRAMEGQTILVNGYMTPLDYEAGKTKLFILSRNPSGCCFGDMPLIHEMIEVRMKGDGVPVRGYLPVQVRGVLHVGVKRNGEVLACIYRLDGETVDEAEQ